MGMCSMCFIKSQKQTQRHIIYIQKEISSKIQTQLSKVPPQTNEYTIQDIQKMKKRAQILQSQSNYASATTNNSLNENKRKVRKQKYRFCSQFSLKNRKEDIQYHVSENFSNKIFQSKQVNKQQLLQLSNQRTQNIKQEKNNFGINSSQKSKIKQHYCIENVKGQIQNKKGLSKIDQQLIKQSQGFIVPTEINQQVFFQNFSIYKGEWMNGMRHGFGILIFSDHSRYEGEWKFGNISGKGKYVRQNGQAYEGQWKNNEVCGTGKYIFKDGSTYIGKWIKNMQEGMGIQSWANGDQYVGLWSKGKKNGYGELFFQDGSYYKGQFVDNQLQGKGQYYWNQKKTYKGQWLHNQMTGYGTLLWQNGDQYEGQFEHDKMNGMGKFFYKNGSYSEGEWKNGRKHGEMIEKDINGDIKTVEWYFGRDIKIQKEKVKKYLHKTQHTDEWSQQMMW